MIRRSTTYKSYVQGSNSEEKIKMNITENM